MKIIKTTRENGSLRIQCENTKKSRTQKHMAEACDLNKTMARYLKNGGQLHKLPDPYGVYADLSSATDYETSLQTILEAQQAFALLPSQLRSEFQNDPKQLLAFLGDEKNRDKAIELGLLKKPTKNPVLETLNEIKNDLKTSTQNTKNIQSKKTLDDPSGS